MRAFCDWSALTGGAMDQCRARSRRCFPRPRGNAVAARRDHPRPSLILRVVVGRRALPRQSIDKPRRERLGARHRLLGRPIPTSAELRPRRRRRRTCAPIGPAPPSDAGLAGEPRRAAAAPRPLGDSRSRTRPAPPSSVGDGVVRAAALISSPARAISRGLASPTHLPATTSGRSRAGSSKASAPTYPSRRALQRRQVAAAQAAIPVMRRSWRKPRRYARMRWIYAQARARWRRVDTGATLVVVPSP